MNSFKMLLNYLDLSNILVILTALLIIIVSYLLLSSELSLFSEEPSVCSCKVSAENSSENLKKEEKVNKSEENAKKDKKVKIKGFQRNELKEENKQFFLGNKTENIEHLSQKINNINNKNDELSMMYLEGLSSLNSWENEELGEEIMKQMEWSVEKRENEQGLISQYIYPHIKEGNTNNCSINNLNNLNTNLSSSQESINSLTETEDGEDEKEKMLLSSYKLGICKTFQNCDKIKTNIVKEINDKFYKIYSEGDPELIKKICRRETIPDNYDEIILKNKAEGNEIIGICGKKMKMNFLQCQKLERNKCESNLIFLGFVFYSEMNLGEYNSGYS